MKAETIKQNTKTHMSSNKKTVRFSPVTRSILLVIVTWLSWSPSNSAAQSQHATDVSGAQTLAISGDSAQWRLTNSGSVDLVIEEIAISWPEEYGNLRQIILNGRVYKGAAAPTFALLDVSALGREKFRTLKKGKSRDLHFKFDQEYVGAGQEDIQIRVLFGGGLEISFDESTIETPIDTTPPVIALLGDNPLELPFGSQFFDPGARATDDTDGDLTSVIVIGGETVDSNTAGSYTILYDVSDAEGNSAEQILRTVIVDILDSSGLPPDPGEDGKITLEGIDLDGDGVRDDIQRWIALETNQNQNVKEVLTVKAKLNHALLQDSNEPIKSDEHTTDGAYVYRCLIGVTTEGLYEARRLRISLDILFLNTEERVRRWAMANSHPSSYVGYNSDGTREMAQAICTDSGVMEKY